MDMCLQYIFWNAFFCKFQNNAILALGVGYPDSKDIHVIQGHIPVG